MLKSSLTTLQIYLHMKKNNNLVKILIVIKTLLFISITPSLAEAMSLNNITSNRVEMDSSNNKFNVFKFYENVHLIGEDLDAVCDELEVILKKSDDQSSTLNSADSLEKITAIGNINIKQTNRTIKAGHAVLYPAEGKIVLTKNPEVINDQGIIQGHIITFYQNDGKAYVEGGPNGERPKITLSNMPNLQKTKAPENTQSSTTSL